ncbi:MAG: hypothetical protein V7637_3717 [Mycobacteriales bacterium]
MQLAGDAVAASGGWSVRVSGMWCLLRPEDGVLRRQGWKLHISATPATAAAVLARVLPVLVPQRCTFKFAATPAQVRWLTSAGCPRGSAGKFLTVYPDDDEHFRRLAADLDRVTAGLAGPEILSDRRYRPGSLVYYRFGGFADVRTLDDDGCYRPMIVNPAGELEEDRREAWFTPPAWAPPPFPATGPPTATPPAGGPAPAAAVAAVPAPPAPARPAPQAVLIDGRYLVSQAIRHSSRGGVFEGWDERTGAPVIIKQARAYTDLDPSGSDGRDRVRHEIEVLGRLHPLGLAPRPIAVVDSGEHVFGVREPVDGLTLRQWVVAHAASGGVPVEAGLAVARRLVVLVDAVHRAGLVLVDVSPNNIIVDAAGELWLIDVDHAAAPGAAIYPVGTPGYTPPEHRPQQDRSVVLRSAADLYGLGALLFLLAVGTDPALAEDDPPGRPSQDRLQAWLAAAADRPLVPWLAEPVLGLMRQVPGSRWRLDRLRQFLDRPVPRPVVRPVTRRHADLDAVDRLIQDGLGWLLTAPKPGEPRYWPSGRFGTTTDPCAVQHGAAGVLHTLVRGAPHAPDPGRVREVVASAAGWISDRLRSERLLPGLYFGRSGTAWALHDAAGLLDDPRLAAVALDLAARTPVDWPSPDVAHGMAGAGMAHLHLWQATGDERFAGTVATVARRLVRSARLDGARVSWPIPAALRSTLAGRTFLGYAHGTAGVGAFLLAASGAAGCRVDADDCAELAVRAADTLVRQAVRRGEAAYWPAEPGAEPRGAGWCTGSTGVGTFLLRAWQGTGDERYLELARAAAAAGYQDRAQLNTAACHGLAGAGQFLLDLADALGEPAYLGRAEDMAGVLVARASRREGRLLVPDETGLAVVADYSVGLAGALAFLLRLRYGGPCPWTVGPADVHADPACTSTTR